MAALSLIFSAGLDEMPAVSLTFVSMAKNKRWFSTFAPQTKLLFPTSY